MQGAVLVLAGTVNEADVGFAITHFLDPDLLIQSSPFPFALFFLLNTYHNLKLSFSFSSLFLFFFFLTLECKSSEGISFMVTSFVPSTSLCIGGLVKCMCMMSCISVILEVQELLGGLELRVVDFTEPF